MRLKQEEKKKFDLTMEEFIASKYIQEMKNYVQHGNTSTFTHCYTVAYYSYWLSLRLKTNFDTRSIIRGAMLHDFYLYDWHISDATHRLHGFSHPRVSLYNAKKHFALNSIERDIIEKHMWPLTLTKVPKYRESVLICMVDKVCSIAEIIQCKVATLQT
ncbi:MAG: hypothetical protein K0S47_142 [Herbinix sp.]|jgi:uncharacterized protein|nr:hypothetical protein [Herbinix sp.]